jgi:hypothetical protein
VNIMVDRYPANERQKMSGELAAPSGPEGTLVYHSEKWVMGEKT